MNHDRIEGRWKQVLGKLRELWGRLTDDDMDVIAGRRDQLLGRIQQRDGLARDQTNKHKPWQSRHGMRAFARTRRR